MTRRLRRVLLRIAAVPAVLTTAFGLVLLSDLLREPAPVPSTPVRRPSPIDRWKPAAAAQGPLTAAAVVASLPKHWLVVGWDGADWDEILPMIERGELPHLARMMREGTHGAVATFRPTLSPVLWTTVATGEPPERHGIEGFEKSTTRAQRRLQRLSGGRRRVLYSNADRKVPALWDLLSSEGRPVLAVGYHNTYPASRVNGLMVSSFLMQGLQMLMGGGSAQAAADRRVFPPELAPEILALQTDAEHSFPRALGRFATSLPPTAGASSSLGLRLANDLPGHPLDAAFERGLLEPGSTRLVYGYTAGKSFHPATAAPGPPDPELELRLRSLGYLQ